MKDGHPVNGRSLSKLTLKKKRKKKGLYQKIEAFFID
jgi:hypothetical protein